MKSWSCESLSFCDLLLHNRVRVCVLSLNSASCFISIILLNVQLLLISLTWALGQRNVRCHMFHDTAWRQHQVAVTYGVQQRFMQLTYLHCLIPGDGCEQRRSLQQVWEETQAAHLNLSEMLLQHIWSSFMLCDSCTNNNTRNTTTQVEW